MTVFARGRRIGVVTPVGQGAMMTPRISLSETFYRMSLAIGLAAATSAPASRASAQTEGGAAAPPASSRPAASTAAQTASGVAAETGKAMREGELSGEEAGRRLRVGPLIGAGASPRPIDLGLSLSYEGRFGIGV